MDIEDFKDGFFDIEFVGDKTIRRQIPISHAIYVYSGNILYLVGKDGTCWNWSTIIRAKRTTR